MTNAAKVDFLKEACELVANLQEGTPAIWGTLNARQMLEHLVASIRLSNGKFNVDVASPAEKLPELVAYLMTEKPYKPGTQNPVLSDNPPLRDASLDATKAKFVEAIERFFDHFQKLPEVTPNHPIFGPLDYEQWLHFHWKHVRHHFVQFGLFPLPDHRYFDELRSQN